MKGLVALFRVASPFSVVGIRARVTVWHSLMTTKSITTPTIWSTGDGWLAISGGEPPWSTINSWRCSRRVGSRAVRGYGDADGNGTAGQCGNPIARRPDRDAQSLI